MRAAAVALLSCLACASAWRAAAVGSPLATVGASSALRTVVPCMMAKKQQQQSKKRRKKGGNKPPATGSSLASSRVASPSSAETPMAASSNAPAPTPQPTGPAGLPTEDRLDAVLRNAGISQSSQSLAEAARPNNDDPLSRIPKKGQELLERFFGGGAITFGSAFLLSGIAVAVEAICKVSGNPLPKAIDEALVQYVEPAMTPSILILFGFSISLGLLKQLQLGSESGGVLYTEDDD